MATTTNVTTSYAGEKAAGYISAALLGGNTLADGGITVKPNVKYREVMQILDISDDIVKDASCDFTATSTITVTERYLDPKQMQVNLSFCKDKFESDWQAIQMGFSAHENIPAEFGDYLISEVAGKVAADVETKIWQGTDATDSFEGFVAIASGSAGSSISGSVISAANVIDELGNVIDAIPSSVYGKEDLTVYVSSNVMRAYVRALGGFAASGLGSNGVNGQGSLWYSGQALDFEGIKLFMSNGLPDNTIFAAQKSNLAFGTGLLSDHNEVKLLDMAELDGSRNVRAIMRFTAGVQIGILEDVVYYGA